jgi:hypothetical protein
VSGVGRALAFAFTPVTYVFSHAVVVIDLEESGGFAVVQSRPHEVWARFLASSMKDDLRYTPSDCFETYPFPDSWDSLPTLDSSGQAYYEFRAALMVRNNEGLTRTYNRFHDPDERDADIGKLRELHADMDRAVLQSYGWGDIGTDCEFLLDYEADDDADGNKKKPWHYRWPDDVRDEVLARLLELNAERARKDSRAGASATTKGIKKRAGARVSEMPEMEGFFS